MERREFLKLGFAGISAMALAENAFALQFYPLNADDILVSRRIFAVEIPEQGGAAPHQHEEPPSRGMILLVDLQVFRDVFYALREQCDLDSRGSRVALVGFILADKLLLFLCRNHRS